MTESKMGELLEKLKDLDPETWAQFDEYRQHHNIYVQAALSYILQGVIQDAIAEPEAGHECEYNLVELWGNITRRRSQNASRSPPGGLHRSSRSGGGGKMTEQKRCPLAEFGPCIREECELWDTERSMCRAGGVYICCWSGGGNTVKIDRRMIDKLRGQE